MSGGFEKFLNVLSLISNLAFACSIAALSLASGMPAAT
jgi:hypothetical protein